MMTTIPSIASRSLRALGLCLALSWAQWASAVEFGAMSIYSKIGQSFSADIQISGLSEIDTDAVSLRVLPQSAYSRLDIPYTPILDDIRLSLSKINPDSGIIQVNTTRPYDKESINLLIEITFPDGNTAGQKIIEYSGILDPTFLATIAEQPPNLAIRAPLDESVRINQELLSSYMETVKGDTWENIALAVKLAYMRKNDISKEQIMMALRERNPDLFDSGSSALVDVDAVVQMPDYAELRSLSQQQAVERIASIDAEYLQSIQGSGRTRGSSTPPTLANNRLRGAASAQVSSNAGSGSGTDVVLERIELVTQLADQNLRDEIAGVYEEIDKRRLESSDLKARVALLDQQAADLQQLVKFKSQQLKLLQQSLREQLEREQRRQNLPQLSGSRTFAETVTDKIMERPVFWLMLLVGSVLLLMMVLFVVFSMRAYGNNVRQARADQIVLNERLARERTKGGEDRVPGAARRRGAAARSSDDKLDADDRADGDGDRGRGARRGSRMGEMVAGVSRRSRIAPPQNEPYKLDLPDILQLSVGSSEALTEERRGAAQQMNESKQSYLAPGNNIIKVNLDLALAYINMRQYEEARSLLNQVLKDGDRDEVQRAQLLLNGMARKETQAA